MAKIYIAGKITGDESYRQKFLAVQHQIEEQGHIALNPAVLPKGMSNSDYMKICFAMIDAADRVLFIRDFYSSIGANLEYQYCGYIGKELEIIDQPEDPTEHHECNCFHTDHLRQAHAAVCKERDTLKTQLNTALKKLEMAEAERDVVTKHMIELESEVSNYEQVRKSLQDSGFAEFEDKFFELSQVKIEGATE